MAKRGMKRADVTHTKPRNDQAAVPEIQGKAKHSNKSANPIIAGTKAPDLMVYHSTPHSENKKSQNTSDRNSDAKNSVSCKSESDLLDLL